MSGIENIVEKINQDNQQKIQELKDNTTNQINEINALEDKNAAAQIERISVETDKKIDEIERNARSGAEMANRQELLFVRQEMLVAVFEKTLGAMKTMDDSKKKAYIIAMVKEAAAGDEKLVVSSTNQIFNDSLLSELNSELISAGKKGQLTYETVNEDIDGAILKKDGMEINLTYEAVIEQIKGEIDFEVSKILFEV